MKRHSLRIPSLRIKRHASKLPGTGPGQLNVHEHLSPPAIKVTSYSEDELIFTDCLSGEDISNVLASHPDKIHYIRINGLGDKKLLEDLAGNFGIHILEIEDVLNTYQRPKVEEYESHLFVVSRFVEASEVNSEDFVDTQYSIFCGANYVMVISDTPFEHFSKITERLEQNKGFLRKSKADYLLYAVMDLVVDFYFPFLESMGVAIDELEDELLSTPNRNSMHLIQTYKRRLIHFRRIVWSEREKIHEIMRIGAPKIDEKTKRYFRDTNDHIIQIMDMTDSYREVLSSLMDIYLSSVSNKLNNVMKVLTIISTIFIPLTFIVGLYGMNFAAREPATGELLPYNMPELYSPYGYVGVIIVMVIVVFLQALYFIKKGWLNFKD